MRYLQHFFKVLYSAAALITLIYTDFPASGIALLGNRGFVVLSGQMRGKPDITFEMLFEANPNPMWLFDPETLGFLAVNKAAIDSYGYTREEFLRLTLKDIRPEQEIPRLLERLLPRPTGVIGTYLHKKKDGKVIDVEITAYDTTFEGRPARFVMAVDVTDRRRAEAALLESESKFRSIFLGSPLSIEIYDAEGGLIDVNPACSELFGVLRPEALKGFSLFGNPHISGEDQERLRRGERVSYECVFDFDLVRKLGLYKTRRSGTTFLSVFITPIPAVSGFAGGFVVHAMDISEKRRAQAAIEQYAQGLEAANRVKDLFADIMRHDILNPLSVMQTAAGMLLRRMTDPKAEALARQILRSAAVLSEMTENAAKYAKLGTLESLDCQELDLREVIERLLADFGYAVQEKGLSVSFAAEGERCVARLNVMISDVFANLLSNAIKYSPPNGTIEVGLTDEETDWLVTVKDQGAGIPDADKTSIFNRFERLEKQGVKGSGLGLAIARQIVALHRGDIWVEDNRPQGSVFSVRVPKDPFRAGGNPGGP